MAVIADVCGALCRPADDDPALTGALDLTAAAALHDRRLYWNSRTNHQFYSYTKLKPNYWQAVQHSCAKDNEKTSKYFKYLKKLG